MPLDPEFQAYLDQMADLPPLNSMTPEARRRELAAEVALEARQNPPESVAHIENRTIPGPAHEIPIRIYTPEGAGPFPVLVFFHGGGWVLGTLDACDGLCRTLTNRAHCVVVSVDYRLAPEHPFPAAPLDCYAATRWVAEHATEIKGNAKYIAVGGDSAGGNLAAAVTQMAYAQGGPQLVFQLLIYPATDFTAQNASMRESAQGYGLSVDDMRWYMNHYLNDVDEKRNPLASPLLAEDLSGLPPALVISAQYDPLRDEGEEYGLRLQEADVTTTISRYEGVIHGFFGMGLISQKANHAVAEASRALRAAFNTP